MNDSQDNIRISEDKYRAQQYLDIADVMLGVLNEKGDITLINKKGCKILGYSNSEISKKNWFDLCIHKDIRKDILGVFNKLIAGDIEPVEYYENTVICKNGETRLIAFHNTVIRNEKSRITGVLFSGVDITERRQAECALWESEERFRTIVEQSPISIQVMNPDGRAILVNRAWEELWGLTMDDLVDYSVLKDQQIETLCIMPLIKKGFSGQATFIPARNYDVTKTLGKGTARWVQAYIYPVKDENGDIRNVVLMHEDMSNQKEAEIDLKKAFEVINRLKEQLEAENVYLRKEIELHHKHGEIICQSDSIKNALKLVEQVAGTDSTVLILGETGTGKELMAQSIHNLSKRKNRPMVKVNCAAIPANLIESELFGREKGAYTGASTTQAGRFEVADGSSLFLDEIGELPSELQAKLLRVIQDGSLERLGSNKTIKVDVRIVAATNRDLEQAVEDGKFRSDLYYRLNVFPIFVPPLRERHEDILPLVWSFIREFEKEMGRQIQSISNKDVQALHSYSWPGNVRELKNLIERSMILTKDSALYIEMPKMSESGRSRNKTLDEIEKDYIISVLEKTKWRVRGENGAAKILGLKPTTLDSRMKKLGIKR